MSCQPIAGSLPPSLTRRKAGVLLLDGDTVRTWYQLYQEDEIESLASFSHEGIAAALPRTTREVGAWIARECGIDSG
jgi:hypothetical protein